MHTPLHCARVTIFTFALLFIFEFNARPARRARIGRNAMCDLFALNSLEYRPIFKEFTPNAYAISNHFVFSRLRRV